MLRERIISQARELSAFYDSRDPWDIAKQLGIEILTIPLPGKTHGCLLYFDDTWYILLSADLDEHMARMTAAHELGHYFLHRDLGAFFMDSALPNKLKIEHEANLFGAYLLYPDDMDLDNIPDYVQQIRVS